MASVKPERARGTRDFAAGDALLRQQIVTTLRNVFELYGYNPLETPIIERFETLASKYAGGEEILKETFRLKDQGGRELGLRYDLTVPMCRFIATNPNLKMPFKRYQIGEVFRDGPLKTGRYREFMQCDVDIVGMKSMAADAEMVEIALKVFDELKIDVIVRVNNRKLLNAVLTESGVPIEKIETVILSLDKLEKADESSVRKEITEKGIDKSVVGEIFKYIGKAGGWGGSTELKLRNMATLINGNKEGQEGLSELQELLRLVGDKRLIFTEGLARGLSYYTSTVYEVFLNYNEKLKDIKSAIAAGGRYDRMIGNFVGSGREYPAVGISFGLDVIEDALGAAAKEKRRTITTVYVIPIKVAAAETKKIATQLRNKGINTDIDLSGRDVKKNLEYAAAAGIPYVVFVGEKEMKAGKIKLRDMSRGKEVLLAVKDLTDKLANA
ncbi:histidine--tRNA ligase [Candidatus Woesearchaeota archaeon]|nr:histidine--tRNA ligase [Candidatus Woesearchaeota archaeon]